jgi:hypothetical protein
MPVYFWIGMAVVVGILGRKNFFGFWGNFVLSMLLSPLVPVVIFALISIDRKFQKSVSKAT